MTGNNTASNTPIAAAATATGTKRTFSALEPPPIDSEAPVAHVNKRTRASARLAPLAPVQEAQAPAPAPAPAANESDADDVVCL